MTSTKQAAVEVITVEPVEVVATDALDPVAAYLSKIGAKGGAAATGKAKKRGSKEHYRELQIKSAAKRVENTATAERIVAKAERAARKAAKAAKPKSPRKSRAKPPTDVKVTQEGDRLYRAELGDRVAYGTTARSARLKVEAEAQATA